MRSQVKTVVFLSAWVSASAKHENLEGHANLGQWLHDQGLACREVIGRWEGATELSYAVEKPEGISVEAFVNRMSDLAFRRLGQEAVLVRYQDNTTELRMRDGGRSYPGEFREVTESYAKSQRGYSLIDDRYFVAGGG
jgi:hypothetical protein